MPKFRIRVDATGDEYTLDCSPHVLIRRALKTGDLKVGSKLRRTSKLDGSTIHETVVAIEKKNAGFTAIQSNSTYPMKCDGCGINPDQYEEAMAADRAMGIPIDYDRETGQAIFTCRTQRKRYQEAHGIYDRNGGYSDSQRRSYQELQSRGY